MVEKEGINFGAIIVTGTVTVLLLITVFLAMQGYFASVAHSTMMERYENWRTPDADELLEQKAAIRVTKPATDDAPARVDIDRAMLFVAQNGGQVEQWLPKPRIDTPAEAGEGEATPE
ncbi:MAG: hypothetical protein ACFCVE_06910 [Phycisphaerae bacterium]